jgi:hypothetical protein
MRKVLVVSNTSGARLETYVIKGERGNGEICMNGAAAHLIEVGRRDHRHGLRADRPAAGALASSSPTNPTGLPKC